jgi:hypothetical protein
VDTGIQAGNDPFRDRTVVIVPAGIGYHKGFRRASFQVFYIPQLEFFQQNQVLNSLNHLAGGSFDYRIGRNLSLRSRGSFIKTNDMSRYSADSLILYPRGDFRESFAQVSTSYRLSPNLSLSGSFANTLTKRAFPSIDPSGTGFTLLQYNQMVNRATVAVSHAFARAHRWGASYTYSKPQILSATVSDPQAPTPVRRGRGQSNLDINYRYAGPVGLNFGTAVGILFLSPNAGGGQLTYSLMGRVSKGWRFFGMGLVYRRTTSTLRGVTDPTDPDLSAPVQDPLLADSIAQVAEFSAGGNIGWYVSLRGRVQASRVPRGPAVGDLDLVRAFVAANFHFSGRFVPFVNFMYTSQRWTDPAVGTSSSVSRGRVTAGIRIEWWQPGRSRLRMSERQRINSTMPYRIGG